MQDNKVLLGEALKVLRERVLRCDQAEASKKAGVGRSQLSEWERGVKSPGSHRLISLLDAWSLSFSDLGWALEVAKGNELPRGVTDQGASAMQENLAYVRRKAEETEKRLQDENKQLLADVKDIGDTANLVIYEIFHELGVPGNERAAICDRAILRFEVKKESAELEEREAEEPRGIRAAFARFTRRQ